MINKLKTINENLLNVYKDDPEPRRRQELIKTILDEPNAFLKMSIETAYKILEDLEISPLDITKVYCDLIDADSVTIYRNN